MNSLRMVGSGPWGSLRVNALRKPTLKSALRRTYLRLFGEPELHSHVRWNGILPLLDFNASRTLEVGCGEGIMLLELWRRRKGNSLFVGIEPDLESVRWGNLIAKGSSASGVFIFRGSAIPLGFSDKAFDQVLLIDVLEHLYDDRLALREIHRVLKPGGRLVISVPTPNFPNVFGREFADRIGHLRDGYWLQDLGSIFDEVGFHLKESRYYTGWLASTVCSVWYKSRLARSPVLQVLSFPVLRPIALLGERGLAGAREASSLAALAERL